MRKDQKKRKETPAAEAVERTGGNLFIEALVEHMREVLEIASHTADHSELREVITILEILRDAGIKDSEGLKDYIFDYELANRQNKAMHEKYEKPKKINKVRPGDAMPGVQRDGVPLDEPLREVRESHFPNVTGKGVDHHMRSYESAEAAALPGPPEIGARVRLIPSHCDKDMGKQPVPCTVKSVNLRGRFFTVRFDGTGITESFHYGA